MIRRIATACVLLAGLGACAGGSPTLTVNPTTGLPVIQGSAATALQNLGTFTVTDINNALALAKAASPPDTDAIQCFSFLGPYVTQVQASLNAPGLTVSGAFSTFEAGRIAISNGQSIANSGLPPALNTACAPLVLDAISTVNALAIKLGGSAALTSIGIPPIPGLPSRAPTPIAPPPLPPQAFRENGSLGGR